MLRIVQLRQARQDDTDRITTILEAKLGDVLRGAFAFKSSDMGEFPYVLNLKDVEAQVFQSFEELIPVAET